MADADNNVQVTFGGAVDSSLKGATEETKAQVAEVEEQVKKLAGQMGRMNSGGAGAAFSALTSDITAAGSAVAASAKDIELNAREIREGLASSMEAMRGDVSMATTGFLRLAISVAVANPEIAAIAAAALVAGGAFGYLAYQAHEWTEAVDKVDLGNSINQITMTRQQVEAYVADIERAANVSASDAQAIIAAFQQFGYAGQPLAELTARFIPLLVQMGAKAPEAAKELAKEFVAAGGDASKYADIIRDLTEKYGPAAQRAEAARAASSEYAETLAQAETGGAAFTRTLDGIDQGAKADAESLEQAAHAADEWKAALSEADAVQNRLAAAPKLYDDTATGRIEAAKAKLDDLNTALLKAELQQKNVGEYGDQSATIAKITEAIKQETVALAELNQKKNAPAQDAQYALEIAQAGTNSARKIAILKEEYQEKIAIYGQDSAQAIEAMTRIVEAQNEAALEAAKAQKKELKSAEETARSEISIAEQVYKQKASFYATEVKTKQLTEAQATAATLAAAHDEMATQDQILQSAMAHYAQDSAEYKRLIDLKNQLDQRYAQQVQEDQNKAAIAATQDWEKSMSAVNSAFTSSIDQMLQKDETWHQARKKIVADLTLDFINFGIKQLLVTTENVAKQILGIGMVTTAQATGSAAQTAAVASAATAQQAAQAPGILETIVNDAKAVFGGIFAFLAPSMGPVAAVPAAAGAAAVSAFAVGTDYVVRGGLALIHPGETIIPAAQGSGPYSGGGSDTTKALRGIVSEHREAMGQMLASHARTLNTVATELASFRQATKRMRLA